MVAAILIAIVVLGGALALAYLGYVVGREKTTETFLSTIQGQKARIGRLTDENEQLLAMNEASNLDIEAQDRKIADLQADYNKLKEAKFALEGRLTSTEKVAGASKALIRSLEKELSSIKDKAVTAVEEVVEEVKAVVKKPKRKYTRKRQPVAKK